MFKYYSSNAGAFHGGSDGNKHRSDLVHPLTWCVWVCAGSQKEINHVLVLFFFWMLVVNPQSQMEWRQFDDLEFTACVGLGVQKNLCYFCILLHDRNVERCHIKYIFLWFGWVGGRGGWLGIHILVNFREF